MHGIQQCGSHAGFWIRASSLLIRKSIRHLARGSRRLPPGSPADVSSRSAQRRRAGSASDQPRKRSGSRGQTEWLDIRTPRRARHPAAGNVTVTAPRAAIARAIHARRVQSSRSGGRALAPVHVVRTDNQFAGLSQGSTEPEETPWDGGGASSVRRTTAGRRRTRSEIRSRFTASGDQSTRKHPLPRLRGIRGEPMGRVEPPPLRRPTAAMADESAMAHGIRTANARAAPTLPVIRETRANRCDGRGVSTEPVDGDRAMGDAAAESAKALGIRVANARAAPTLQGNRETRANDGTVAESPSRRWTATGRWSTRWTNRPRLPAFGWPMHVPHPSSRGFGKPGRTDGAVAESPPRRWTATGRWTTRPTNRPRLSAFGRPINLPHPRSRGFGKPGRTDGTVAESPPPGGRRTGEGGPTSGIVAGIPPETHTLPPA